MKNPCARDCERRKANCHATCPDGIAYEEDIRERNAQIQEAKAKDHLYKGYKRNEYVKVEKFRRNKQR